MIKTIPINLPLQLNVKKIKKDKLYFLFWISVISVFLILSFFYLIQVNREVSERYSLISYERELNSIIEKNEKLQTNLANSMSLSNIAPLLNYSGEFVQVENVKYVKIQNSPIVLK